MKISFHKHFTKTYQKLPKRIQNKVDENLTLSVTDPFHPSLNNHKLQGH